jgi:beta-xylosidase
MRLRLGIQNHRPEAEMKSFSLQPSAFIVSFIPLAPFAGLALILSSFIPAGAFAQNGSSTASIASENQPTNATQATGAPSQWGDWRAWGDQGDGTYVNPVLPADFSDIDCIRVGSDYYAISSTFQFSPGMVILHSRDLVNWTMISHAVVDLTQISPELNWDKMNRYGRGIWAGSIRYHDGKFWIYFGTSDEGYFMTTAKDISGPWAPLHCVLKEAGWDDCCPFWDDDGRGYLVGACFRDGYQIHLWKLTADGRDLVPHSDLVIHQSRGSEANKLYKFNGVYYHLFSEVNKEGRVVMMERSKNIFGPYTEVKQLNHADREAHEPNQGGLVQTEQDDWYWFTHHGTGAWEGRCASLLPVTWIRGWPIIGRVGPDGIGQMVWSGKKPVSGTPVVTPRTDDEFDEPSLPPQWEWNYQPRAGKWSLTERPGWLRLHAFKPLQPDNLLKAGNTLTQRAFRTTTNIVTLCFDFSGMTDGQVTGLCHFSRDYSALGVRQQGATRTIEFQHDQKITPGPVISTQRLWLRSTWGLMGRSEYSYSVDGTSFTSLGETYQLGWGHYRGDRIGIYCYNDKDDNGYVDVDFFHYQTNRHPTP